MKTKSLNFIALAFIAISIIALTTNWSPVNKDILTKTIRYNKQNRQEKLYLHTDKPIYSTNETVWFSVYLNEVITNQFNTTERVVYVELLSPHGETVLKKVYNINAGRGAGQFVLTDTLSTGNYLLLGYTNWMRNIGSDFYFKKSITIINKDKSNVLVGENTPSEAVEKEEIRKVTSVASKGKKSVPDFNLRFFPEGGYLVHGIPVKVAFEGNLKNGKTPVFEGEVMNDKGEVECAFKALWEGKGFFTMTPDQSKNYKVVVNKKDTFKLPKVQANGYQLAVSSSPKAKDIKLDIQYQSAKPSEAILILAMQDQKPMFAVADTIQKGHNYITIDKAKFNTGIVQFTLFDDQKIPQCERLYFVNHDDFTSIQIKPQNENPGYKEKVTLDITTLNAKGEPVPGSFSLAVTDAEKILDQHYNPLDFVSYNIFGAHLPYYTGDASFAMQNTSEGALKTELVMLTNGWRRYEWKEVLNDTLALPEYLEEPGIYIKGKVLKKSGNKLAPEGVKVYMSFRDTSRSDRYIAEVDERSEFTFLLDDLNETLIATVTTKNKDKKTDYTIEAYSNLALEGYDHKSQKYLSDKEHTENVEFQGGEVDESPAALVESNLVVELARKVNNNFYMDTTQVSIAEVKVMGDRIRSKKDNMIVAYGAPTKSLGSKQIETLAEERSWNTGLISVIERAIPGLEISLISSDSADVSEYIQFSPRDRQRHRFLVYVDGEMVGATDDNGVLKRMLSAFTVEDLIGFDSRQVNSIDLIYPQQGSKKFVTNADALQNAQNTNTTNPMGIGITDTRVGVSNTGEPVDPIKDLEENPLYYTSPEAILSIYTKSGRGLFYSMQKDDKGVIKVQVTGFTKTRSFYSPDYSNSKLDIKQDNRSTLYWNPIINTNKEGKAQVTFYNSTNCSLLRAEAVGLSYAGQPGNTRIVFGKEHEVVENNSATIIKETKETDENESMVAGNWSDDSKQKYLVKSSSGNTVAYAFASVAGNKWSTLADANGVLYIDKDKVAETDTLFISDCSGESLKLVGTDFSQSELVLKPDLALSADEEKDGEKIFSIALRSITKTKLNQGEFAHAIYRQQIFKRSELHHLVDLKSELHLPDYADVTSAFTSNPLVGRIFKVENYDNKSAFRPYNNSRYKVPILDPFFADATFLKASFKKHYEFTYQGTCMYQNRKMYKVGFDQKDKVIWPLSSGYALIDAENMDLHT